MFATAGKDSNNCLCCVSLSTLVYSYDEDAYVDFTTIAGSVARTNNEDERGSSGSRRSRN